MPESQDQHQQYLMDPITKLSRDLRAAARELQPDEARYLVDYYYQIQEARIRSRNQERASTEHGEPHEIISWIAGNTAVIERNIKSALGIYAESTQRGAWSMSMYGIGPVISAGLLAHIDVTKAKTVSAVWRFAGLDPTSKWGKGQRRPWNARLKVICWHAGECFKRTSTSEKSFYGPIYRERKELEVQRNEAGEFADQAAQALKEKNYSKTTDAYKAYIQGKLPAARLDLRAARYAVKLFLSHYWQVAYQEEYGKEPPPAWILTQPGHSHLVPVPGWPVE